ncbi:YkgJ family cysteine cluster protein [Chloroflexota bacterium]
MVVQDRIVQWIAADGRVDGACRRCGECCVCWFYETPDQVEAIPPRKGWCPHLDLESRLCLIWNERPQGCRSYPKTSDFEEGKVLPGCGFRLVRNGGALCQDRR